TAFPRDDICADLTSDKTGYVTSGANACYIEGSGTAILCKRSSGVWYRLSSNSRPIFLVQIQGGLHFRLVSDALPVQQRMHNYALHQRSEIEGLGRRRNVAALLVTTLVGLDG